MRSSSIISTIPPVRVAITGRPEPMASMHTFGKFSQRDGTTAAFARDKNPLTSLGDFDPWKRNRGRKAGGNLAMRVLHTPHVRTDEIEMDSIVLLGDVHGRLDPLDNTLARLQTADEANASVRPVFKSRAIGSVGPLGRWMTFTLPGVRL